MGKQKHDHEHPQLHAAAGRANGIATAGRTPDPASEEAQPSSVSAAAYVPSGARAA